MKPIHSPKKNKIFEDLHDGPAPTSPLTSFEPNFKGRNDVLQSYKVILPMPAGVKYSLYHILRKSCSYHHVKQVFIQ